MENEKIVTVGSLVSIKEGKRKSEKYLIVDNNDVNFKPREISKFSPIGKALMQRRAGEEVTAKTPSGSITFIILEIEWLGKARVISDPTEKLYDSYCGICGLSTSLPYFGKKNKNNIK